MIEWHEVIRNVKIRERRLGWGLQDYAAHSMCPICGISAKDQCFCLDAVFGKILPFKSSSMTKARRAYVKVMNDMQYLLNLRTDFEQKIIGKGEAEIFVGLTQSSAGNLFKLAKIISEKKVELKGGKWLPGKPDIDSDEIMNKLCALAEEGLKVVNIDWWGYK